SRALCEALQLYGKAGYLTKRRVETELGPGRSDLKEGDPLFAENLRWFSKQANDFEILVFEAEFDPSPWSRQCIREADRFLLVGSASESENSPTSLEKVLAEND